MKGIAGNGGASSRQILGHRLLDEKVPCGFVLPLSLGEGLTPHEVDLWCLADKMPTKCYYKEEGREI